VVLQVGGSGRGVFERVFVSAGVWESCFLFGKNHPARTFHPKHIQNCGVGNCVITD